MAKPTKPAPAQTEPQATVRVRATRHLAEVIAGNVCHFAPKDEFELPAERAAALAHCVSVVGPAPVAPG